MKPNNDNITTADDPVYPPPKAAEYVGGSQSTLAKKRMDGTGPEYLKIGRKVVYRKSALDEWLDSKKFRNTGEY